MVSGYRGGEGPFEDGSGREGKGLPQAAGNQAALGECDGYVPPQFPPQQAAIVIYPIGWWGKGPNDDPPGHFVTACY